MVLGTIRIETRISDYGSEPAVYRVNDEKQRYLMLTFDESDEARTAGKAIAKLLGVKFKDHIYTEPKLGGVVSGRMSATTPNVSNPPKLFTRPKKVMGAPKLCEEMLTKGTVTDQEIKTVFADKYIQAGHKSIRAWQLAKDLLKAAKKKVIADYHA